MFKSFTSWVKKDHIYAFLIFIIVVLAIFLRTYNYSGRIYLQADNAEHVQVSKYAAVNLKIPLAGPFSSAGPFFYGPWHFWLLEVVSFIPLGILTPWYFISLLYLLFIPLVFWLGKEVGGKWVGGLGAFFAAISPAQIDGSFAVWSPTVIPILTILALIFLVRFFKFRKYYDLFLLSFFVSLSISIHFQSFLTTPAMLAAVILIKPSIRNYLRSLLCIFLGMLIPMLPLIYLDSKLHWFNFINLFVYFTVDQYSIWVPNRWITYAFDYWPKTWANIVGGSSQVGLLIIIIFGVLFLLRLRDFKKKSGNLNTFYLVAVTFLLEILIYRYYRGERFTYYSMFAHGTVLVLTAWTVVQVFSARRIAGIVLFLIITFSTLNIARANLASRGVTLKKLETLKSEIYSSYPSVTYDVYGCMINANAISHPMALLMYYDHRNSIGGAKVGVCEQGKTLVWERVTDLIGEKGNILWYDRSTETVYNDTALWFLKNPPSGDNSNFWHFVFTKLSPRCWPHCP